VKVGGAVAGGPATGQGKPGGIKGAARTATGSPQGEDSRCIAGQGGRGGADGTTGSGSPKGAGTHPLARS
jgi:hypothetical protein